MNIYRLFRRLPRPDFAAIDQQLTQFWFYRALCGGLYVKFLNGDFYSCEVSRIADDGSRFLKCSDGSWFHETLCSIEKLEEH